MKLRQAGSILALAATAFLAGCAAGGAGSEAFSERQTENEIKVFVTNLAFTDATIYGVTFGGRRRLGRITGKQEAVFTMPLRAPTEMYLEIDIFAGPTCTTERLTVDPGDHLELIIRNDNMNWMCRGS